MRMLSPVACPYNIFSLNPKPMHYFYTYTNTHDTSKFNIALTTPNISHWQVA